MADSELSRTHPLTVAVRSAKTLGQGIAAFVAFTFFGAVSGSPFTFMGFAALILLGTLVTAGFSWLNWHFFRYGVVGDDLLIDEGWLVKKRRSIPLARVQGVDIRASVVSRLLGLADVLVQTAGGGEDGAEARIGSIPLGDAERLRARLIGRASSPSAHPAEADGGEGYVASATGAPQEGTREPSFIGPDPTGHMSDLRGVFGGVARTEPLPVHELKVPLSRLVVAGLTSNGPLIAVAATLGVAGQFIEIFDTSRIDETASMLAALAIPALIALALLAFLLVGAVAVAITIARDYGFTIRRTGDRLETEAGLLERRMTSVPVRRIQSVVIESNPLRRLFRLASVTVNTAGFGASEDQQAQGTSSALVPLAKSSEIRLLLHALLWEAENFATVRPLPRRALRLYVLVPTLAAAVITLAAIAVAMVLLREVTSFDAVVATAPLVGTGTMLVACGVVAGARALAWRAAGWGLDDDALVIRWGVLGIRRARVSRSRIQSLSIRQNPFQHRAAVATLSVASVSGSSRKLFSVRHIDVADASRIEAWYSPGPPDAGHGKSDPAPVDGSATESRM